MEKKNVAIYVDYDNLFKRMKEFGAHPIDDVNFFMSLKQKFNEINYNILKFTAFADFTDKDLTIKEQTKIHSYGIEVFHCNTNNKNTTDSELIIKVMKDLYSNSNIDIFVIVTNDRDFVPLIRAIKERDKLTFTLTTKTKVNPVVNIFSDYHQYLEDLFDLESMNKIEYLNLQTEEISEELERKALLVSEKYYSSGAYKLLKKVGTPVELVKYAVSLSKIPTLREDKESIIEYFKIANSLEIVELVEKDGSVYIYEGKQIPDFQHLEVASGER